MTQDGSSLRSPLMDGYLAWLDGLCSVWLSVQQAQCPEAFQGRGVVVPESQVTLALSGQGPTDPMPGFAGQLTTLEEQRETAEEPLARLLRRIGARGAETLAVILALAPQFNRKYERVFAYLQDDARERRATLGLCADLWSLTEKAEDTAIFALGDGARPVNRFVLKPEVQGLSSVLDLRPSALIYLSGGRYLPEPLRRLARQLPPMEEQQGTFSEEDGLLGQAVRFTERCAERGDARCGLLQLCGAPGTGRRTLLRRLSARTGRPVLQLDCRLLAGAEAGERRELAAEAASWCYLQEAVPALCGLEDAGADGGQSLAEELLAAFRGGVPLAVLCVQKPMRLDLKGLIPLSLTIPYPTIGQQRACWGRLAAERAIPLDEDLDLRRLAGVYTLTPGQIEQVLDLAETSCLAQGQTHIDAPAVALGVRQLCSPRLGELTQLLQPAFTWDDLVLEKEAKEQLGRLRDRVRCRWQVNEAWGFQGKLPYGGGLSACFYGPPGTGKTMAAQVLSRELGLDTYRVDMSRIMDKYIGETEKKLAELFDAAKDSNAILFFDEADALFAKRTEVGDSKDRYANVETAYLLQRMEQHNGISILATNAVQNFDEAFKRRISYMIHMPMPDEQTRQLLWVKAFPPQAPLEGVNLDFFAKRFELTGSSIKSVALSAAYLAAAKGGPIGREELIQAVREEYQKTGRVLMEHELY